MKQRIRLALTCLATLTLLGAGAFVYREPIALTLASIAVDWQLAIEPHRDI